MNTKSSFKSVLVSLSISLFAANFSASAQNTDAVTLANDGSHSTACIQVIPCDGNGDLLPGMSFDNPCFSGLRAFCEDLKQKALCKESLNPLYKENSKLYDEVSRLQSKVKKLNKKLRR